MSDSSINVLLIDDDVASSSSLLRRLEREEKSFTFTHYPTADEGLRAVGRLRPMVVIVDLGLEPEGGPQSGLRLIRAIFQEDPTIRILALTGHDAAEVGVDALRAGAASFLQKPALLPHLLALVRDGVVYAQLKREYLSLQECPAEIKHVLGLTSRNKAMLGVLQQIRYAAGSSVPVLLLGETGTGKGVIARAIHQASSRARAHFVRVQPQFGSPELAASELFGHTRGAFTGALTARKGLLQEADKGTIFFDEVDQLPRETQVALLEVLQEKVFRPLGSNQQMKSDFRTIAASNRPAATLVADDALRLDLFHRIAHCSITLPALRQRAEDIPDLARLFHSQLVEREELPVHGFSAEALDWLARQEWPGNVRQLQGVVENAVYQAAFQAEPLIEIAHLSSSNPVPTLPSRGALRDQVRNYEYELVVAALKEHHNNQTKAAQSLQLDRTSLRRILERKN